jgi:hypothetical protein
VRQLRQRIGGIAHQRDIGTPPRLATVFHCAALYIRCR